MKSRATTRCGPAPQLEFVRRRELAGRARRCGGCVAGGRRSWDALCLGIAVVCALRGICAIAVAADRAGHHCHGHVASACNVILTWCGLASRAHCRHAGARRRVLLCSSVRSDWPDSLICDTARLGPGMTWSPEGGWWCRRARTSGPQRLAATRPRPSTAPRYLAFRRTRLQVRLGSATRGDRGGPTAPRRSRARARVTSFDVHAQQRGIRCTRMLPLPHRGGAARRAHGAARGHTATAARWRGSPTARRTVGVAARGGVRRRARAQNDDSGGGAASAARRRSTGQSSPSAPTPAPQLSVPRALQTTASPRSASTSAPCCEPRRRTLWRAPVWRAVHGPAMPCAMCMTRH